MIRFQLRTLLILLTMLGVLFARIGYLKHKTESHRQRVTKLVSRIVEAKENVANVVTSEMIKRAVSVQLSDPTLWKKISEAKQNKFQKTLFYI